MRVPIPLIIIVLFVIVSSSIYYFSSSLHNNSQINITPSPTPSNAQDITFCTVDSDCGCGINKKTNVCAIGNVQNINTETQCPDFCSGIEGNLVIKCVENKCSQVESRE